MRLHLGSQVVSRIRFCLVSLFFFSFFLFGGEKEMVCSSFCLD